MIRQTSVRVALESILQDDIMIEVARFLDIVYFVDAEKKGLRDLRSEKCH